MSDRAVPTFEEFLETLRDLEADGSIRVLRWPVMRDDTFVVKVLKGLPPFEPLQDPPDSSPKVS